MKKKIAASKLWKRNWESTNNKHTLIPASDQYSVVEGKFLIEENYYILLSIIIKLLYIIIYNYQTTIYYYL